MSTLYTIGHSTRSAEEFLELLRSREIEALVDVRRFPGSRRHPHFGKEELQQTLPAEGIAYHHRPDLGGRRSANKESENGFWRVAGFRAYADYLATSEFMDGLRFVEELAQTQRVVFMCAEAVPWRCHRQLIADALVARGHEVRHILSAERTDAHKLNPAARRRADGTLYYPDPAPTLPL